MHACSHSDGFFILQITLFMESANLIGHVRHDKKLVPWDTDADLGMMLDECVDSGATRGTIQKALPDRYRVVKFRCRCHDDCNAKDGRVSGVVADTETGVIVDIFTYAPVKDLREWQEGRKEEDGKDTGNPKF